MKAIKLVGCNVYHYYPMKKNLNRGEVHVVQDGVAAELLKSETDQGMPYFVEVDMPADAVAKAEPVKAKAPAKKRGKNKPKDVPAPEPVADPVIDDGDTEGAVSM
jgi:hypothetical protein